MDSAVGFININQNKIIKIFSVVSVELLPPTLIASIYGMNFKGFFPELERTYGYLYALVLMFASAVVPMWCFRKRGWLKQSEKLPASLIYCYFQVCLSQFSDLGPKITRAINSLIHSNFKNFSMITCAYLLATWSIKLGKSAWALSSARSEIVRTAANGTL